MIHLTIKLFQLGWGETTCRGTWRAWSLFPGQKGAILVSIPKHSQSIRELPLLHVALCHNTRCLHLSKIKTEVAEGLTWPPSQQNTTQGHYEATVRAHTIEPHGIPAVGGLLLLCKIAQDCSSRLQSSLQFLTQRLQNPVHRALQSSRVLWLLSFLAFQLQESMNTMDCCWLINKPLTSL